MLDKIDHSTKVTMWCLGALNELENMGLVESDTDLKITNKGIMWWDQLDAEWKPTTEEILWFATSMQIYDIELLHILLLFRDQRDLVQEFSENKNEET